MREGSFERTIYCGRKMVRKNRKVLISDGMAGCPKKEKIARLPGIRECGGINSLN